MIRYCAVFAMVLTFASGGWSQPPAQRADVTVRLLAPDGETALTTGVVVLAPPGVELDTQSPRRLVARVGTEGAAAFKDVPLGPYQAAVCFRETRVVPFQPTLPPAMVKEIEVTQDRTEFSLIVSGVPFLRGRLTEADGQTPVADKSLMLSTVRLSARPGGGGAAELRWGRTDADGRFLFPQPPPEPCVLRVTLSEERQEGVWFGWTHDVTRLTPAADEDTEVTLRLPGFPSVVGRVLDVEGQPLANAEVRFQFQTRNGLGYQFAVYDLRTSGEGTYRIPRIPLGVRSTYVRAGGRGYALGRALSGKENETLEDIDFRLRPFASVVLTVRDAAGKPMPGARLGVQHVSTEGPVVQLPSPGPATDDQGKCTLSGLPEGNYAFGLSRKLGSLTPQEFTVRPGQKLALTVTLGTPPAAAGRRPTATGAHLAGRVTDEKGVPIEGARVLLDAQLACMPMSQRQQGPVQSAGDGSFMLAGVREGPHTLVATAPKRPTGFQFVEIVAGEAPKVSLVLRTEGALVEGRIADKSTGAPLAGVHVLALLPTADSFTRSQLRAKSAEDIVRSCQDPFPHAATNEDGRYVLGPLAPGLYTLVAAGGDFPPLFAENVLVPRGARTPIQISFARLPDTARTLSVRVLMEDGKPLANMPMKLHSGFIWDVTTDGEGRLEKDMGRPGIHTGTLWIDGYEPISLGHVLLGGETPSEEITVRAKRLRYGSVRVRVVYDDSGEPAVGVSVVARPHPSFGGFGEGRVTATTDAAGKAALGKLRAGGRVVLVATPEIREPEGIVHAAGRSDELMIDPDDAAPEVTIRLPVARSISGTVVDADGKPCAGTEVTAYPQDRALAAARVRPAVASGPDGSFMLTGLTPGEWSVSARLRSASSIFPGASQVVSVRAGQDTTGIRIETVASGGRTVTVTGQVFEPDGRTPAAGALVWSDNLRPVTTGSRMGEVRTVTGPEGKFALTGRAEGSVDVVAWLAGVGIAVAEDVRGAEPETNLTLVPDAALSGRVMHSDGTGVAGAVVRASLRRGWRAKRSVGGRTVRRFRAVTDDTGAFLFPGLPPGEWSLHAGIENVQRSRLTRVELEPDESLTGVTLTVERLIPEVRGRVFGPDGKTPLRGAYVSTTSLAGDRVFSGVFPCTQDDGIYRFQWVLPGTCKMHIVPVQKDLAIISYRNMELTGPQGPDLTVPRGGEIMGWVVGGKRSTSPLDRQIRTHVGRRTPEDFALSAATARLDHDGSYRLEQLLPGEYTVYYYDDSNDDEPRASVSVTVGEGEKARAPDIVLQR